MAEIPYNYPDVSGGVIDLYSRWTETLIPEDGFPAMFRHPAPVIRVRAGEILGITGDKTFNIDVDDGNGGTTGVRALRIKFAADGASSTYQICQCYERAFALADTMDVTVVTSDVYDDDANLVLRGGEFNYTFAVIVYEKDCPYAQQFHFLEYRLGDEVHTTIGGAARAYELLEQNYGVGGGISPEDRDFGGKVLANAQGYPSGLELSTIRDHGGALLAGTASRPGLYWFRVWFQSINESPHGTGAEEGLVEFPGGENSEIFVVSIRPRSPVEGDLALLVDAPTESVDKNTFQVLYSEINNVNDFQTYITSKEPTDVWEHHDELWTEPEVWTQPPGELDAELLEWLASLLSDEDEPGSGSQVGNSGQSSSAEEGEPGPFTGNVHLPGYWSRSHSIEIKSQNIVIGYLCWWYVICRDADGYWRLYCALDTNATYSWFEMARVPAFGLDDEMPPKYWPGIKLCAKGSERYTVEGKGVFAWAGTFEYLPPGADENAEPVTVEVYGQEPIRTPRYQGWTDYLPPEWQYHDNKLLYKHPEHGWVCVPKLATNITAENVDQYRCVPSAPVGAALPFAPVRPPQSRGGLTFERDLAVAGVNAQPGMLFGRIGEAGALALLAQVGGHAIADAVWWRYPLFRFWNPERFRMTIHAAFRVSLSGDFVNVPGFDSLEGFEQHDSIAGESPWSDDEADYPYPQYHFRSKSHSRTNTGSESSGVYSAELTIEDIPCYVSDYLLIACVSKGTAATAASATLHTVTGTVRHSTSSSAQVYGYKEWDPVTGELTKFEVHRVSVGEGSQTYESGDIYDASGSDAKCSAWINASLGFGCDVSISPVVMRGDKNRPRQVRVFGAALSASCDWTIKGRGERGAYGYTEWESDLWTYNQNTDAEESHTVAPRPAWSSGSPFTDTNTEHCDGSWDSGLVMWNENGGNQICADRTTITASLWKSASYFLQTTGVDGGEDFEGEESWSQQRRCDLTADYGHVSGRTMWGEQTENAPTKYPLQEVSASASLVDYNDANNSENIQIYDQPTGTKHSVDDVLEAYARYCEYVEAIESPTLGDVDVETYPGDRVGITVDQDGYRHESRRETHVSMTVTITDADPEPED